MQPPVAFPGKDDAVSGPPHQLILSDHALKHAAGAFFCAPDHLAFSGCYIGHHDRPRHPGALGSEDRPRTAGWIASEGDAGSIRRPNGVAILVYTGGKPA